MNPATQSMNGTTGPAGQVRLKIAESGLELVADESEKMRAQIQTQATEMGPILEALLRDTRGQIRWGLNE